MTRTVADLEGAEMNFKELGELLRSEREKRGLAVEDVMEVTRISRCNVEAIERGDSTELPYPVYTKGFVRNYARFIGVTQVDYAEIIDCEYGLKKESGDGACDNVSDAGGNACSDHEPIVVKKSSKLTIALIIFLVILLVALVAYWNRISETRVALQSENAIEEPVQAAEPMAEPETATEEPAPSSVDFPPVVESEPLAELEPEQMQEETPPVESVQPETVVEETAASDTDDSAVSEGEDGDSSDLVSTGAGNQTLLVVADEGGECWIQVLGVDDDEKVFDFILSDGAKREIRFSKRLKIKLGNASSVTVFHNGEPVQAYPGHGAVVRTLTFPPS